MENKVVLITGASAGFGEAIAKTFAKEKANLILLARRKDKLEALSTQLQKEYGIKIHTIIADVADFETIQKELANLPKEFAYPDILINNAGFVKGLNKLWETPPQDFNAMIDVNIKGVLNLSTQIIPKMLEKNKGHIINIGSISGYDTYPGGSIYCATKFAVRALTDTLRKELVATPLRVSLVSPGIAETEFSLVRFSGDKEKAEAVYDNIQALTPQDVADTVLFIASRPPHVNIADIVVYPTNQASVSIVHRS